jgi:hypothetical protein
MFLSKDDFCCRINLFKNKIKSFFVLFFGADEGRAGLDGGRPITNVLVLVEDEAVRAGFVVLNWTLADEVHGAIVLVAMKADLALVVIAKRFLFNLFILLVVVRPLVREVDHVAFQLFVHGLQERILSGATMTAEVIQID